MVGRNLSEAHLFIIYTDRPEPSRFDGQSTKHQQLEVRDLQGGGLKGFFGKLKLFDQGLTGGDPFLYLDSTLVIRSNLGPLVELGRTSHSSPGSGATWARSCAGTGTDARLQWNPCQCQIQPPKPTPNTST
jgi:hypothetical protein